jgi:hypothetical protein
MEAVAKVASSSTESVWMSAKDIAQETRLSLRSANQLMHQLPSFTVGQRSLRVQREDFELWRQPVESTDIRQYRRRA